MRPVFEALLAGAVFVLALLALAACAQPPPRQRVTPIIVADASEPPYSCRLLYDATV
jgi:hypothetical protein